MLGPTSCRLPGRTPSPLCAPVANGTVGVVRRNPFIHQLKELAGCFVYLERQPTPAISDVVALPQKGRVVYFNKLPRVARNIQDILDLRRDVSPFLIHLTRAGMDLRTYGNLSGTEILERILGEQRLLALFSKSDVQYGGNRTTDVAWEQRFLKAVSFSETPLDETHCLLEIAGRRVKLEPYGLVFFKDLLAARGVSPVIYLNNMAGDKDQVAQDLFALAAANSGLAQQILPLVSFFGKHITPPGARNVQVGVNDWRWEREWRYPGYRGPFTFDVETDVFAGLCPDDEIAYFEGVFPAIPFIDPRRPLRWYSTKLINRRRAKGMTEAVV